MKKALLVSSLVMALVLAAASAAFALTSTVTVTATVPGVFHLTVSQPTVAFGNLTEAELTAGKTVASATDVQVVSNRVYTLSNATSDFADAGTNVMPADALSYSWTGSTTGSGVASNSAQNITNVGARGNTDYNMSYTLTPTLQVEPASYTGVVTYTAIQNP